MKKKVLIATGGTGGHIFPAISFAEELCEKVEGVSIHFAGGKLNSNKHFNRDIFSHTEITCGQITKNPFQLLKEMGRGLVGVAQSYKLLRQYQPDLVVGFGSYYAFPILLGAHLLKKPVILHESNSIPGRVNRLLSPLAKATATVFPEARLSLYGLICPVLMPLRKDFRHSSINKEAAVAYFGLQDSMLTFLVFGGSQGANRINELFLAALTDLRLHLPPFQVIHLLGNEKEIDFISKIYEQAGVKASVKAFEKEMALAWKAADLVISRSGASTIAEALQFEIPGLFVPYPHATDQHQERNAQILAKAGAAFVRKERDLNPKNMALAICQAVLELPNLKMNIQKYKKQSATKTLADLALEFLNFKSDVS